MANSVKTLSVLTFGAVCSILAITVPASSVLAQVTLSSAVRQSNFNGLQTGGFYPLTASPYDFRDQPDYLSFQLIESITVTLRVIDGDTGQGTYDFNNLSLGLDGIDTGILLNGFPNNSISTRRDFTETPNNSQAILSALQADGLLVGSVIDSDRDGGDDISFPGNFTTNLEITGEVPFNFSPGLGILVLGGWGVVAQLRKKVQKQKSFGRAFSNH